jgi:hypothetical protein
VRLTKPPSTARPARGGAWKAIVAGVALAPLALVLGGAPGSVRAQDPATAPPPAHSAAAASTPQRDCMLRFLGPLHQLAGESPQQRTVDWALAAKDSIAALRTTLGTKASVDAMIATVPDPVDSGLDYAFDTTLQALRLGLERGEGGSNSVYASLYRDRSWLPWRDLDASGKPRAESTECRETTPGAMLFRDSGATEPHLRLLLLVGETPTRGLHVAAMVNALHFARALTIGSDVSPNDEPAPPSSMRIVGPTFSGGAFSLRLAIEKWAKESKESKAPLPSLHIVTGSATGSSLVTTLGPSSGWMEGLDVSFDATTVPAGAVECAYLHFVRRLGETSGARRGGGTAPTLLTQVAMLHESGTEFGASATPGERRRDAAAVDGGAVPAPLSCDLQAGVRISFPVHIASLRHAYEELDRKETKDSEKDNIARPTSLEVSLRENRPSLDAQSNPSPRTTYAQDVALASVLGQISVEKVRHVGIQATDVADAIFLARKIRDIAPDVRLAFFEADALLLHREFQRDLRGSLVVSPYPFLGSSPFESARASGARTYAPFENAAALGTFNAILAARGWSVDGLLEYTAPSTLVPLPIWHSAIGRNGIVPLAVVRSLDCQSTIYGEASTKPPPDLLSRLCDPQKTRPEDWPRYNHVSRLDLRSDVPLPRLWLLLFALLTLAFVIDQYAVWKTRASLAKNRMPAVIAKETDHDADIAIGRTKWLLYAAIRTFLFALAFLYICYVDQLSVLARTRSAESTLGLRSLAELLAVGASLVLSLVLLWEFLRNYGAFAWAVRKSFASVPLRTSLPDVFSLTMSASRQAAARTSCAQLGLVALFAVSLSCMFAYLLNEATFEAANVDLALSVQSAVPALTLLVQRTVSLGNGVSPAAPALLCLFSVYMWSVGRMARLFAAHGISRISPNDKESDLVSTPLRLVLYPSHDPAAPSSENFEGGPPPADGGFTRVERAVVNSIWRPIAGPLYVSSAMAVIVVPLFLFAMKPLATVEVRAGTWLLAGGLVLSTSLIGLSLIQLIRYWLALEHLLKRTMAHPLGPALSTARSFAHESVDDQLSRSPNDLLRLAACSEQFGEIIDGARAHERIDLRRVAGADDPVDLLKLRAHLQNARNAALDAASARLHAKTAEASAELGQCVIEAAAAVTRVLQYAWKGQAGVFAPDAEAVTERLPLAHASGDGATNRVNVIDRSAELGAERRTPREMPSGTQALGRPEQRLTPPSATARDAGGKAVARSEALTAPGHRATSAKEGTDFGGALAAASWQFGPGELAWLRDCQAFVATVVALIVSRYVRQFRYFLYAMTASIALLLLALASYPFEPHRLLLSCSWGVVGSVVGAGLWIFIELDRNTVISQLNGTAPGKVTLNGALALRVLAWVILPVLGVAATTYPDIANMLYRIVEPFVRALR